MVAACGALRYLWTVRVVVVVLAAVWLAAAAEPAPTPDQARLFLEAARQSALLYSKALPDFLCTQIIRREQKRAGQKRRPLDTLAVRLTYVAGKEEHELVSIDGRPTDQSYLSLVGSVGEGEFGGTLHVLFDPDSAAEFRWHQWTRVRGRRAAVYAYEVAPGKARYSMYYRTADTSWSRAVVGFHGLVTIDRTTYGVLQLVHEIDHLPEGFPVQSSTTTVEYEPVKIAGRRYLLPARAATATRSRTLDSWNRSEFRGYRKYTAESRIIFHGEK